MLMNKLNNQREQFKRLGVRGDWENPYITLKPEYEAQQIKVFGEMAKKGYIYKGKKPVYWSPSSESALAEAEIEYQDKRSASIYVAFEVTDGKGVIEEGTKLLSGQQLLGRFQLTLEFRLHPQLNYVVVEVEGEKFVVAEALLESVTTELRMGKSNSCTNGKR